MEDSGDGLLECIRVYGNLSRYPAVRDVLAQRKGDDFDPIPFHSCLHSIPLVFIPFHLSPFHSTPVSIPFKLGI